MGSRACHLLLVVGVLLCGAGMVRGAPLVAGDEHGTWIIAPPAHDRVLLLFLPAGGDVGAAHLAGAFPRAPLAIACEDEASVLIFPPHEGEGLRSDLYPVRRVIREADPATRELFAMPQALAPLPIGGAVVDVCLVEGSACVLLRDEASGAVSVRLLRENAWGDLEAPGVGAGSDLFLARFGASVALVESAPSGGGAVLWLGSALESEGSGGWGWTSRPIPLDRPVADVLEVPSGLRLVTREGPEAGSLDVFEFRSGELALVRTVERVAPGGVVGAWGAGLAVVRPEGEADSGVGARLFDAEGEVVFDGPVVIAGPISPAEVQILVVLLSSVFLTAIVFVLRPEGRPGTALNFPEHVSLATPARRSVAYAIDLLPGIGIAYALWFLGADTLEEASAILADRGAAPILTAAAITIVHSAVGEATIGRTLGKAICRCRTVAFGGGRPGWKQSLARNAVKVLCPPLGLFVLLGPASVHPGSFETLVVVDDRPGKVASNADPGDSGRSGEDDRGPDRG